MLDISETLLTGHDAEQSGPEQHEQYPRLPQGSRGSVTQSRRSRSALGPLANSESFRP